MNKSSLKKLRWALIVFSLFLIPISAISENNKPDSKVPTAAFIKNVGQIASMGKNEPVEDVLYYVSTPDAVLYIRNSGLTYVFTKNEYEQKTDDEDYPKIKTTNWQRVDVEYVGANLEAVTESGELPWKYNFYYSHCPKGIKNVNAFQSLYFKDVYNGVDFNIYFTEKGDLKYDFIVQPKANPNQIKIKYNYSNSPVLNNDGSLTIANSLGTITEKTPYAFQGNELVNIKWNILENNTLNFKIDNYDNSKELIIDPFLLWSTYLGGNGNDVAEGVAANGNIVIVSGNTTSSNFPVSPGVSPGYYQGTLSGSGDYYIAKFNDSGVTQWITYYGGTGSEEKIRPIIVNNQFIYLAGQTNSTDIPTHNPGGLSYFDATASWRDAFLIKMDMDANVLWASYFGGDADDASHGFAVSNNAVFIIAASYGGTIPLVDPGGGAYQQLGPSSNSISSIYVSKFDIATNQQTWGTYIRSLTSDVNGGSNDYLKPISNGTHLFMSIVTKDDGFPITNPGGGAYIDYNVNGNNDNYICKFSESGVLVWSTYFGGNGNEAFRDITFANNKIWLIGYTTSTTGYPTLDPVNGAYFQSSNLGGEDAIIASFETSGKLLWSTYYGGSGNDRLRSVGGDDYGVFVTGYSYSGNTMLFDPGTPTYYNTSGNMIIGKFKANGKRQWMSRFQGAYEGRHLTVTSNAVYIVGVTTGSLYTLNPGGGAYYQSVHGGNTFDTHIAKFDKCVIPNMNISASINPICLNNSTILTTTGEDVTNYLWETGSINSSITVTPTISTNYSAGIIDDMTCTNTDSIAITVNPLPNVSITGNTQICFGDSTLLTANGASTYVWNTTETDTNIYVNSTITSNFSVEGTDTNGCKNTDTVQVIVNPLPNVSITGNTPICFGDSTLLTANGASTYVWNTTETDTNIYVNPTITSNFSVEGTDTNGCKNSDTIQIIVNTLPNVFITGDTTICFGDSTLLIANGASTYVWSTMEIDPNIYVNPTTDSNFSLEGTDLNGCKNNDTIQVTVNPLPNISITGNTPICFGDSTLLTANGASTYVWNTTETDTNIYVNPTITSNFSVEGTDANGCKNTDTVQVIVNPLPNVSITGNTPICFGDITLLTANGASTYVWNTTETDTNIYVNPTITSNFSVEGTDTNGCKNSDTIQIIVNPLPIVFITGNTPICFGDVSSLTANGAENYVWNTLEITQNIYASPATTSNFSVEGTDINGCKNIDTIEITVNPKPSINITGDTLIIEGTTSQLTVTGADTYSWTPSIYLSCSDCNNPVTSTLETMEYCVEGINSFGCLDTSCINIVIDKECGETFVPSGFSPNSDGNNDVLYVRSKCLKNLNFVIYNRWGEKVFETTNPDAGWDGSFRGKYMDTGVFVYYLTAEYYNGVQINQKGNITLIR